MILLLYIFAGVAILSKSADIFVDGATNFAKRIGVSDLIIGLTIVAIGTSAPELFVNVKSVLGGHTDLAVSNILGSNIANILFILGVIIILSKEVVFSDLAKRSLYISILFTILLGILGFRYFDDILGIGLFGGFILLISVIFYSLYIYKIDNNSIKDIKNKNTDMIKGNFIVDFLMIVFGIMGLVIGGDVVVKNSINLAILFGISQRVIGLTIIAIGTSLPELITSIAAIKKGNPDIAIGNVLGSNISNIGFILGISSIIKPLGFYNSAFIDIFIIIFASLILVFLINKKSIILNYNGFIFILLYFVYLGISIFYI